MEKITAPFAAAFILLMGGLLLALLLAWPTQLLWNSCLVPAVNPINEITFWQALGMNVLFSIWFGTGVKHNQPKK